MENYYYDWNKLLSYDAQVYIVVGGRGLGKGYGAKRYALSRAHRHGERFVYVRQTDKQLKAVKSTFLLDLVNSENQADSRLAENFYIWGNGIFLKKSIRSDSALVGSFSSLNTAFNSKSLSLPNCRTMIIDEFISEEKRYLPTEMTAFNSLVSTFFRNQKKGAKLFLIANAISVDNPYFAYFGIKAPTKAGELQKVVITRQSEAGDTLRLVVVAHFPEPSRSFKRDSEASLAGMINSLSDYGRMSIGNEFFLDDNSNVLPRSRIHCQLSPRFNVFSEGVRMGVYSAKAHDFTYIGMPISDGRTYVLGDIEAASKPGCYVLGKKSPLLDSFVGAVLNGFIAYETLPIKNAFLSMLKIV